jgi:hypothetical protein
MNLEHGKNGEGHKGLDWFRTPESKILRPVWWNYAEKEKSPRMGPWAALYGQLARVSI